MGAKHDKGPCVWASSSASPCKTKGASFFVNDDDNGGVIIFLNTHQRRTEGHNDLNATSAWNLES
eukprot:scaffold107_cov154-Amphora_coffeaeformis.AAC.9